MELNKNSIHHRHVYHVLLVARGIAATIRGITMQMQMLNDSCHYVLRLFTISIQQLDHNVFTDTHKSLSNNSTMRFN